MRPSTGADLPVFLSQVAQAEAGTVTVDDLWPLAAALKEIEKIYVLPITYEDPRRVNDWESTVDDKGRHIEKTERLSFTYEDLPEDIAKQITAAEAPLSDDTLAIRKKLAAKAIADVLRNYDEAHGGREYFAIIDAEIGFHVVPKLFIDESGRPQPFEPLLNTPITLPAASRSYMRLNRDISAALIVATGQEMYDRGPTPINLCDTITVSASNEPARAVLDRFADQVKVGYESAPNKGGGVHSLPSRLSWQLICVPDQQFGCSVVFHVVAPTFHIDPLTRQPMYMGKPCRALYN